MQENNWKEKFQQLWDKLVPSKGPAETVQGELVRAIGKLTDEAYRNGNINWDVRHRKLCQYLRTNLRDTSVFNDAEIQQIDAYVDQMLKYKEPDLSGDDSCYYHLTEIVVRWCDAKRELIPIQKKPHPHI